MDSMVFLIVATTLGDLLIVTALVARYAAGRERHVLAWLGAFVALALSHALWAPVMLGYESLLIAVPVLFGITLGVALLVGGTYAAVGRQAPRWWWALYGLTIAVGLALIPAGADTLVIASPGILTMGLALVVTGVLLIRWRPSMFGAWFAGIGMIGLGVNIFSYGPTSQFEWYVPIGTLLGVAWQLVTGFGLLLVDVEHATRRAVGSERAMDDLVRNAEVGIYRTTPDGRILLANPAFVAMLGFESEAELLELSVRDDLFVDPDERETLLQQHIGRSLRDQLVRLRRKDGTTIAVAIDARDVAIDGELAYYEGFARDVTDSLRLQAELQHARRTEAVGRLAGGVAHDFNNLLTVISANLELLGERPDQDELTRTLVDEASRAQRQAARLTRQLLDIGRPGDARRNETDLARVVRRMREVLDRSLGETVRLELDADDDCYVLGERSQLEQMVLNLVLNARDALPDGGTVRVALHHDAPVLPDAAAKGGDWLLLEVADDGLGMSEEVRSRIFEPFFTTKEEGKGTGLGLATVHAHVRSHGGVIAVESAVGAGTTFRIWLPAHHPADQDAGASIPPPERSISARHVLVVEDRPEVRSVMSRILRGAGHRVTTATDGPHALSVASGLDTPPDLLLTDVVMPAMSGPELASALRSRWPELPILFVSGFPGDFSLDAHPGARFLAKPFGPAQLLEHVAMVLSDTGNPDDAPEPAAAG